MEKRVRSDDLNNVIMHNETIAAQLTIAVKASQTNYNTEKLYKEFLDKLNKGEI